MRNILTCLVLLLFASCAYVDVFVKPDSGMTKSSTLAIECDGTDWIGAQSSLEHALLKQGFDVVWPAEARARLIYQRTRRNQISNPSKNPPDTSALRRERPSVRDYGPVYLLRYKDAGTLQGSIINLRTGEVVGTVAVRSGLGQYSEAIYEQIAAKISQSIK